MAPPAPANPRHWACCTAPFDPQSGAIRIDGIDLRDIALGSLRRHIGVVFQEPMLFARSIRENLTVGKPDATDDEINLALERAQAKEIMARQTDGLDTLVGERGRTCRAASARAVDCTRAAEESAGADPR